MCEVNASFSKELAFYLWLWQAFLHGMTGCLHPCPGLIRLTLTWLIPVLTCAYLDAPSQDFGPRDTGNSCGSGVEG